VSENGQVTPEEKQVFLAGYQRGYYDAVMSLVNQYTAVEEALQAKAPEVIPTEDEDIEDAEFSDTDIMRMKEALEAEQEEEAPPPKKKIGRPKGSKNKKPRAKREPQAARPAPDDPSPPPPEEEPDPRPAHERLAEAIEKDPNLGAILGV
jgi:hypothetical protein